jgi:hypothetical protein
MELDTDNDKWENLPKHIICSIAKHLPLFFQLELRQLNKTWRNSLNEIIFQYIENINPRKSQLAIDSYGSYFKSINSLLIENLSEPVLYDLSSNIKQLTLVTFSRNFYEISNYLVPFQKLSKLAIIVRSSPRSNLKSSFDALFQVAHELEMLKYLEFSLDTDFRGKLPKFGLLQNLAGLTIKCNYYNFMGIIEECKNLANLEEIKFSINYYDVNSNTLEDISSPDDYLVNSCLKRLSLKICSYVDYESDESIEEYLSNELVKLFSNPYFNNLTNLEWMFLYSTDILPISIFNCSLPKTRTWSNLASLKLFAIDGILLAYIIEHCPNLIELAFNSPLTLPNCNHTLQLEPLRRLERLSAGGLDKLLINNESIIHHLFPEVKKLSLAQKQNQYSDNQVTTDLQHVPLLFPNLKVFLIRSFNYSLKNLIKSYSDMKINWEELYIMIDSASESFLKPLMDILPKLRLIYLNLENISNFPDCLKPGVRYFKVAWIDGLSFDFKSIREI